MIDRPTVTDLKTSRLGSFGSVLIFARIIPLFTFVYRPTKRFSHSWTSSGQCLRWRRCIKSGQKTDWVKTDGLMELRLQQKASYRLQPRSVSSKRTTMPLSLSRITENLRTCLLRYVHGLLSSTALQQPQSVDRALADGRIAAHIRPSLCEVLSSWKKGEQNHKKMGHHKKTSVDSAFN